MKVRLRFDEEPIPMPRAQRRGRQTFMPKNYVAYQERLGWAMRAARRGVYDNAVEVYVRFVRSVARRCDIDNLQKALFDSMTGVLVADDAQIRRVVAELVHDPTLRHGYTELEVDPLGHGRRDRERDLRVVVRDQAAYIRTLEDQLKPYLLQPVAAQDAML